MNTPINPDDQSGTGTFVNVSSHLKKMAGMQPYKRAVVSPAGRDKNGHVTYAHLTFQQLDHESDCLAHGLKNIGITRGTRTILMIKPCLDFFVLTFALFKVGAIPVVVDPGMGIRRMVRCLSQSRPEAFIGIPRARLLSKFYPKYFNTVEIYVTTGKRWFRKGFTLKDIRKDPGKAFTPVRTRRDETAAILFTTGSTGPAKGAVYTHGIFDAQVRYIRAHFNITADEIDLPTFPLFALFDPALGMTAVIPDMDPTKPGSVNPEKIIEAITDHGVTNMFASPALLNRVGNYGMEKGIKLPSFKRVVSAGAPVYPSNIEQFSSMLCEDAEIHTPYGATEAVPILSIASNEILFETRKKSELGFGLCVGRPVEGLVVRIIKINDDIIGNWSDDLVVPDNEIGEIAVTGDLVTRQYFENPSADELAKIKDGNRIWHRMGDLGYKDLNNRIWFCGRKSHRVVTEKGDLFTIPCEAIFNNHPMVSRSALVGIGTRPKQKPVICIELKYGKKSFTKKKLKMELLGLGRGHVLTENIDTILFHKSFPVDIRHNSKIYREKLAQWAEKKAG